MRLNDVLQWSFPLPTFYETHTPHLDVIDFQSWLLFKSWSNNLLGTREFPRKEKTDFLANLKKLSFPSFFFYVAKVEAGDLKWNSMSKQFNCYVYYWHFLLFRTLRPIPLMLALNTCYKTFKLVMLNIFYNTHSFWTITGDKRHNQFKFTCLRFRRRNIRIYLEKYFITGIKYRRPFEKSCINFEFCLFLMWSCEMLDIYKCIWKLKRTPYYSQKFTNGKISINGIDSIILFAVEKHECVSLHNTCGFQWILELQVDVVGEVYDVCCLIYTIKN